MKKNIVIVFVFLVFVSIGAYFATRGVVNTEEPKVGPRQVTIGVIYQGKDFVPVIDGFKEGVNGIINEKDVHFNYNIIEVAGSEQSDFDDAAVKLVQSRPDLIFAIATDAITAAKNATVGTGIPVIFGFGGDPADLGFVRSMHDSGNNLTGVTWRAWELSGKRLDILKRIVPNAKSVLVLVKREMIASASLKSIQESAKNLGITLIMSEVDTRDDLISALSTIDTKKIDGVTFVTDPFFLRNVDVLIDRSIAKKIPIVFQDERFVRQGGLASYGAQFVPAGRQAGYLAKKILVDGQEPTDLPTESSVELRLVLNEDAAKKMGVTFPDEILSIANEIIHATTSLLVP